MPQLPLDPVHDLRVAVSRFATIRVLRNVYSVPARLIGQTVLIRVRAETLDLYLGAQKLLVIPRLRGYQQHRIDERHIIDSRVRKPGAFAQYRYQDDLFPSLAFRQAYDTLKHQQPQRGDQQYVRLLHVATTTSEREVELALGLLHDAGTTPTLEAVRDLVGGQVLVTVPDLAVPVLDFAPYDQLLSGSGTYA